MSELIFTPHLVRCDWTQTLKYLMATSQFLWYFGYLV